MTARSCHAARWIAASLLLVGFVARVLPFADRGGRLLRQFPTEDGYLMLVIARNIALGRGMSTADGTMPTNGTQPLVTFLWSVCSLAVGNSKAPTVAVILVVQLLLATATAYVIHRLARRILPDTDSARDSAMLAASGWYACSTIVSHTMNCLESGLYVLIVATIFLVLLGSAATSPSPRYARWAGLGALLGVAFWARNDVVLLCGAIAFVELLWGLPGAPSRPLHRLAELTVAGVAVVVIAAPWLAFNYTHFGHVMPISGQSEAMDATFGSNAALLGPTLFTYATFLPIPNALVQAPWVVAAATIAMGLYVRFTWVKARAAATPSEGQRAALPGSDGASVRQAWLLAATGTLTFTVFYGFFFGAPHFMSRYLLALSPLYAVAWGAAATAALSWLARVSPGLVAAGGLLLIALPAGLNLRTYRYGSQHPHFQVVEWVNANVPESTWVGAAQSGTLGYFHDRTINFDGKVNPAALEARRHDKVARYAIDSGIRYFADWEVTAAPERHAGAVLTMGDPVLAAAFEVVVDDKERNLAVLRRRDPLVP